MVFEQSEELEYGTGESNTGHIDSGKNGAAYRLPE
jgi:hypothetical protein